MLNGIDYKDVLPDDVKTLAEDNGIVIVYGWSDDILEFDGAMHDEVYVSGGDVVKFDRKGVIPEWDDVYDEGIEEVRRYLERIDEQNLSEIKVMPEGQEGYFWAYETDIPHSTFEVLEDGERFCKGIVFDLNDVCGF